MTTAVTPHAANHAGLAPMASRFVTVADLPWEATSFEGVEAKTLLFEKSSGLLTALLRMAPGAELPDHTHMQIEQTWVLEGRLVCGEGECGPGDFVWRPAGSRHRAWCPAGGLMIGIFMVPNKFHGADGERDMLGKDWQQIWSRAGNLVRSA